MTCPATTPLLKALQAIENDGIYLSGSYLYSSTPASHPTLRLIWMAEEFANLIKRTNGPLFEFSKTAHGTIAGKHHDKASQFYGLEQAQTLLHPAFEPSEALKVLHSTWRTVFGEGFRFTGSSDARVNGSDVLEGELINTYVARCRDTFSSKRYREQLRTRNSMNTNLISKASRYAERLSRYPGNVLVSRYDLGHQPGQQQAHKLRTADELFCEFLRILKHSSVFPSPLGHIQRREYLPEIGFRTHLVLFSDFGLAHAGRISADVTRIWRDVAGENASLIDYSRLPNTYRSWGCGELRGSLPMLIEGLRRLLQRDLYLRLVPNEQHPHFGMSNLPKSPPLDQPPTPASPLWTPFSPSAIAAI